MSSNSLPLCVYFLLAAAIGPIALGDLGATNSTTSASPKGPVKMLQKIVGGTAATDGQFPYQVQLIISATSGSYLCGGTIVSSSYVVSAAHCFSGIGTFVSGTVYAGSAAKDGTSSHAQSSQMATYWLHSQYSQTSMYNDLAIITLSSPFTLNSYVAAMPLAASSATFATGISCTVSGWGDTTSGGSTSGTLMYASVTTVAQSTCGQTWSSLPSTAICTSTTTTDTCQGDSGGPVICSGTARDGSTTNVLAGIVSYGSNCASGSPAVNTRVSSYSDLIYSKISGTTLTTAAVSQSGAAASAAHIANTCRVLLAALSFSWVVAVFGA